MVHHEWGDDDFDWEGLNQAQDYIWTHAIRWGRMCFHTKEKYGTIRYEWLSFGVGLHRLFYPAHLYIRQTWLYQLDYKIVIPVLEFLRLDKIIMAYQWWVFKTVIKKAIKKWPHLKKEILADLNYRLVKKDWIQE